MSPSDALDDPERSLALTYAPVEARASLAVLLGLDDALAALLRSTTEPAIAQIRLAWWRERLSELGRAATPAMPVLQSVSEQIVARGIAGERLVAIVEGWEILIEAERLDRDALSQFAEQRGGRLFAIGAELLGAKAAQGAGEGWALADLAKHLTTQEEAMLAREMAIEHLGQPSRWPRQTRALGALAAIARMNMDLPMGSEPPIASPRRVARLAWMRLTGR